jgi:hypothetical protein
VHQQAHALKRLPDVSIHLLTHSLAGDQAGLGLPMSKPAPKTSHIKMKQLSALFSVVLIFCGGRQCKQPSTLETSRMAATAKGGPALDFRKVLQEPPTLADM